MVEYSAFNRFVLGSSPRQPKFLNGSKKSIISFNTYIFLFLVKLYKVNITAKTNISKIVRIEEDSVEKENGRDWTRKETCAENQQHDQNMQA